MQCTGAYKVRGAYYKISTLSEEERAKGLITASAGNHAQGVAYAAHKFWCKGSHRYADYHTAYQGRAYQELRRRSHPHRVMFMTKPVLMRWKLAEEEGYTFVHPFDDPAVATGQGTIAMEIVQELPTGRLYPGSDRRRRTGNRCFHSCQAV